VIPLILILVFIVLVLLLRALVAPVLLLVTVVASFFASMGAGWWIFTNLLGFPALDLSVFLFSFLFLVALGVDYNIFLVTRAKEEAEKLGTREGMVKALSSTGAGCAAAGSFGADRCDRLHWCASRHAFGANRDCAGAGLYDRQELLVA
jgi:RND superfamily putative drug exporter